MKSNRVFYLFLLAFLTGNVFLTAGISAKTKPFFFDFCSDGKPAANYIPVKTPTDGGIREVIDDKYRERYEKWKTEFLATEFGREQWDKYAANKNFILIIKIGGNRERGAGTADYQWDENGKLVGATIILGSKIDKGYPNPIYFPVMNSLSVAKETDRISKNILAAAKIAHEFGHVNNTSKTDGELFRLQNRMITEYNEVLQKNNFKADLPLLADLRETLGGTPTQIWENREYWGETNAMFYLLDRIENEKFYCRIVGKIETNIKTFATDYEDRFSPMFEALKVCRD